MPTMAYDLPRHGRGFEARHHPVVGNVAKPEAPVTAGRGGAGAGARGVCGRSTLGCGDARPRCEDGIVTLLFLIGAFLSLWAGSSLLLSCLPWLFHGPPLGERLVPYAPSQEAVWVHDVEVWLGRQ